MSKKQKLSSKERGFVNAYVGLARGNGTVAARMAGYKGTEASLATMASRMLRKVKVRAAVDSLTEKRAAKGIATAEQIDAVMTEALTDSRAEWRDRIRAGAELNKVAGRHSVKVNVHGTLTLEQAVQAGRDLEAERKAAK